MIFIGVTGGIGSGKSLVCSLFEKKEVSIFFSDIVAKEIIDSNPIVFQEIVQQFGDRVVDSTKKKIDRKVLADIVFRNSKELDKLNGIVHPKVFDIFEQWKKGLSKKNAYALVESAILFESGMFELIDYTLAVITDEEERIRRVSDRDSVSRELVLVRMKQQLSHEELLELSDFQIHNNGTIADLTSKVNFFHTLFSTLTPPKELE